MKKDNKRFDADIENRVNKELEKDPNTPVRDKKSIQKIMGTQRQLDEMAKSPEFRGLEKHLVANNADLLKIAGDYFDSSGKPRQLTCSIMKKEMKRRAKNGGGEELGSDGLMKYNSGSAVEDVKEFYDIKEDPTKVPDGKKIKMLGLTKDGEEKIIYVPSSKWEEIQERNRVARFYEDLINELRQGLNRDPTMDELIVAVSHKQSVDAESFARALEHYEKENIKNGYIFDKNGSPVITDKVREDLKRMLDKHPEIINTMPKGVDIGATDKNMESGKEDDEVINEAEQGYWDEEDPGF